MRAVTRHSDHSANEFPEQVGSAKDASGYRIFSASELGEAHVMAHRMLDENRPRDGHRQLGEWLEGRRGCGSEWVHLQFHMAVFEIAVGEWNAAFERFLDQVLPTAARGEDALTDAPQLLWRLALSAPRDVELPWEEVRRMALARLQDPSDPFVEMHSLLALAGAGDLDNLVRWAREAPRRGNPRQRRIVERFALALTAYVARRYRQAARIFADLAPHFSEVGGSRAQNQLFEEIAMSSWRRVADPRTSTALAMAA
jgi:hypothetical protein